MSQYLIWRVWERKEKFVVFFCDGRWQEVIIKTIKHSEWYYDRIISDDWRPCQCTIYFLREVPTMDLKDRSPGSMSAVLILGIWKASSFSLSKFILELSLSVSESTAAWFWSFTRLENILQPTETSLTLPAIRKERRARGRKTLNQLFHWYLISTILESRIFFWCKYVAAW